MSGPKLLLRICLLIWLTVSTTLCSRNIVDQSRLIADRPKHQSKQSSPWDQNTNLGWKNKQVSSVPPYAVKMEPMVHYSQQDPLYVTAHNNFNSNNNSSTAKIDFVDNQVSGSEIGISSNYGPPNPAAVYGVPYQPADYYKEPEPIIEIIIKESNESLPAPPTPPPIPVTRPPKEPVQVFYVKYKKNPNSYGDKEDIIYEPPVPALTPSTESVSESETTYTTEPSPLYNNYVTGPPSPSTTYRTIIKPDSEIYHGTGLKVTFGNTESSWSPSSLNKAENRDSVSEASDVQNKLKKNTDQEFKRSFVQPQPADYQRSNNFENSQIANQPQFNGFNTPNSNVDLSQQQLRKPSPPVQNYFQEDSPRSHFQGQIPVINQPFKPQPNNFQGIVEQRPSESKDNFRNQPNHHQFSNQQNPQQFNNQPNTQQFNNQPNTQQFTISQSHQQINNQPNHHQHQLNNQQNHQQLNNHQNHQQFNNPPNHQQLNNPLANSQLINNQQSHQLHLNNQQFSNQQNHQHFINQQQRQPDFQTSPLLRNPSGGFQERPVQIKSPNNERPLISKPIENRPPASHVQDRPFDNRPFESRPVPDKTFENRPFENIPPVQNRPFDNQPTAQSKPFENRPIFDRPYENRPFLQNRPVEISRPTQDRPFDNRHHNQVTINYRPNKPPTSLQSVPANPNPSFTPNDRRPTVPPPQLPTSYNTQPIGIKHTVDLPFFSPQQQQQQQQQQQFQQQQFQQQQYKSTEIRPSIANNNNPTLTQQQLPIKQQQFSTEVKTSQHQHQQPAKQQYFIPEPKQPSSTSQIQITQSNGYKLEQIKQQPTQSSQFIDINYNNNNNNNNRYQQPVQTEQNSFRTDNNPWQPQSSFKLQEPTPSMYKEYLSASTLKNTIDTTGKSVAVSKTTEKPSSFVTSSPYNERSTTPTTVTTAPALKQTTTEVAKNITEKPKNTASLPDEVPDELREQLLSSGILSNADIQILDYDKVGDIPIESLPPEALENFYGQGSAPVPSIVLPPKKSDVQMKVVKYDPSTEEGRKIENTYVDRSKSQTLDPVVLNDTGYNRFLPLNINGTYFPIPNSPLLKNKAIGSVVILSPVGYDLSDDDDQSRVSRNTAIKVKGVHFVVGDIVKNLVRDPNRENFETWLEKERGTPTEEQSVVLLVTKPNGNANGKEIYMYDVTHNQVNKLSGELSATFVDVAESNSLSHDLDNLSSEEEVDVVVSGNSTNNDITTPAVSGYSKTTNDSLGSIVATANN